MTTAFAAGTRILTARGECAVEALREGDSIETVSGAFRPLVFLGRRRVDCARHPRPGEVCPVRVREAAFADGLPSRDLRLSPEHAVYIDDVSIPIRALMNGVTIVQEAVDEVIYWHLELAGPDVIFAEGLPCESQPGTDGRSAFENGGTVLQLYPGFGSATPSRVTVDALAKLRGYLLDRGDRQRIGDQSAAGLGNLVPR